MLAFLLGVVLGAIIAFLGPSLLPQQYRNAFVDSALRIIGVLAILFAIASTSFVRVPDGYLGQLFRVYGGGSLSPGPLLPLARGTGPPPQNLSSAPSPPFHVPSPHSLPPRQPR